jgi:proline iminopeptidase
MIAVTGGRVWYQIVGTGDAIPLLTLHGGPGFPHNYLLPLAALADERPIVFYDQLGCGRSDRPDNLHLWRADRFVEELATVRQALGLDRIHLLGQSWGTMLATDYMLTQPAGVISLILASPPLSIPRWLADAARYRAALPTKIQAILARHEATGTTDSAEYEEATMVYYRRHVCRLEPWPEPLERTLAEVGWPVYHAMWGPNEFFMTGNLKDYDRTDRLGEITVPTLFTCGRYDEATPEATAWYQSLVPGAEVAIFEQSSHLTHLEEPETYLATIRAFLRRVEERVPSSD